MAGLPADPQPYGSAAHPVRLDPWHIIKEVHWGGEIILVELPNLVEYPILLGQPAGLSLTKMEVIDPTGLTTPFGMGPGNEYHFAPGLFLKSYTNTPSGVLIPKSDYLVGLKTTANLHGNTTVDAIASTVGLDIGSSYPIDGGGLQSGSIITLLSASAGALNKSATSSASAVPVTVRPWAFQPTDHAGAPFRLYPYMTTADSGDPSSGYLIPPLPVYTFDLFLPPTVDQVALFFSTHPAFAAIPHDHFVVSYFSPAFPQPQTVDYNGFPMGGDTIAPVDAAPAQFVSIWQVLFDYSVYSQSFLVNMSLANVIAISEQFSYPVSDPAGVRISAFPSGTDFFLRADGYIDAVIIDPVTGDNAPVPPLWQGALPITAIGQIGAPLPLTELGRFDKDGLL